MAMEMKEIRDAMPQVGQVKWIGLRPARQAPINVVNQVAANDQGLEGDFFQGPHDAPRQVTLIQEEHVAAIASILGRDSIPPELLRRNIVVAGINLQALKETEFQVGDAILYATGNCAPCSLMEENLGIGGYNAMRGHGGITARVVQAGLIQVSDKVRKV